MDKILTFFTFVGAGFCMIMFVVGLFWTVEAMMDKADK